MLPASGAVFNSLNQQDMFTREIRRKDTWVVNKWNEKHTDPVTSLVMPTQQSPGMKEYLELARRMKEFSTKFTKEHGRRPKPEDVKRSSELGLMPAYIRYRKLKAELFKNRPVEHDTEDL